MPISAYPTPRFTTLAYSVPPCTTPLCEPWQADWKAVIAIPTPSFITTSLSQTWTRKPKRPSANKAHPKMTLAQLYNPETMPMNLKQAHAALDDVIDDAYGYTSGNSDAQRVAFLFELLK